ncbi:MAG: ribonuclease HII [Bacteroidales bacterium]|jgi:ribonuclease HII|nr:ribonuclease HII [Bacteroidales bacterium]NLM91941.1 ribonuclease HII [Bacteroidales bacterium]
MRTLKHQPLLEKFSNVKWEAGCDEAGRGCLAGPVFAAAVILPDQASEDLMNLLDDSKKTGIALRNKLRRMIEQEAVAFAVSMVSPEEIDRINILNASILAMHRALEDLSLKPGFIVVDGNRFKPFGDVPHQCIIKGDGKYLSVAAASILAKTWRDEHMLELHAEFPAYHWDQNKGYPTAAHLKALETEGPCKYHRLSYGPVRQLKLSF